MSNVTGKGNFRAAVHFFLGDAKGIPYYFQAERLLIGLKSVLTNQCDEFRSLETCENRF